MPTIAELGLFEGDYALYIRKDPEEEDELPDVHLVQLFNVHDIRFAQFGIPQAIFAARLDGSHRYEGDSICVDNRSSNFDAIPPRDPSTIAQLRQVGLKAVIDPETNEPILRRIARQ